MLCIKVTQLSLRPQDDTLRLSMILVIRSKLNVSSSDLDTSNDSILIILIELFETVIQYDELSKYEFLT